METLLADGWEVMPTMGYNETSGPFLRRLKGGRHEFGLLATKAHANPNGNVHGGAIMTMVDIVLGTAAREELGISGHVTIQLDIKFKSAGMIGDFLHGQGKVGRDTSSIVFLEGDVMVGDRVLASATGLWKKRRPKAS